MDYTSKTGESMQDFNVTAICLSRLLLRPTSPLNSDLKLRVLAGASWDIARVTMFLINAYPLRLIEDLLSA